MRRLDLLHHQPPLGSCICAVLHAWRSTSSSSLLVLHRTQMLLLFLAVRQSIFAKPCLRLRPHWPWRGFRLSETEQTDNDASPRTHFSLLMAQPCQLALALQVA